MIFLKFVIEENEEKSWIESEGIKTSSILMILKKNLGFKNQEEICEKTYLDPYFLRIKLCWKTDAEYSELTRILNGLVNYYTIETNMCNGRTLLNFVEKGGKLFYIPYHTIEGEEEKSLKWFTLEKTMERWIKEKF